MDIFIMNMPLVKPSSKIIYGGRNCVSKNILKNLFSYHEKRKNHGAFE